MAVVINNGVSIYYEVHGSGDPLVFVLGSGGNHAAWWQQVTALRGEFTVVTVDLQGFGKSDSAGDIFDAHDHPGDILAVLRDADLADAVLVGESIGAAAALKAALREPDRVRGVILAHSLGGIDHTELAEWVREDRANAEKRPVFDRLLSKSFQEREPAKAFLCRQMGTFNIPKIQDLRNLTSEGITVDQLSTSNIWVAFLVGERDAVLSQATVRRAHELLSGSLLEVVPDAPHSMYSERPELFNAAVALLAVRLRQVTTIGVATA